MIIAEGSTDRTLAAKRWAEVEQVFANGATLERNSLAEAPNVAKTRRTALGKALVFRVARDQAWRSVFNSEHDAVTLDAIGYRIGPPICHIDADNHAWLESLVEKGKWPTRSSDGAAAAHDAWLLAQHADNYPDFQERVLALMAPLIKNGEASGKDYAYLFDRVALARKRPQRYATQFEIDDKGCQRPQPTEDFAHINVRRAEAHLEPIEEYAKRLRDAYKQPVCLPPPFGSN